MFQVSELFVLLGPKLNSVWSPMSEADTSKL